MPIQHAVLGLLDKGPRHGYRLAKEFEAVVGPGWGSLNLGNLQQVLDRLGKQNLIVSKLSVHPGQPDRIVHRITTEGRRALDEWLFEASGRSAGYRDDFILRVMVAATRSPDEVRAVCRIQQDARMAELHTLQELREDHDGDPIAALTLEAAILHANADLRLIDIVDERADDLDISAITLGLPAGEPPADQLPRARRERRRAAS